MASAPVAHEGAAETCPSASIPPQDATLREQAGRSILKPLSIVLSLALHGGAVIAGAVWARSELGAIKQTTEAISVELAATLVVEAVHENPVPDMALSMASVAERQGDARASSEAEPEPAPEIPLVEVPPAEALTSPLTSDAAPVPAPETLNVIEGGESVVEIAATAAEKEKPNDPDDKAAKRAEENARSDQTARSHDEPAATNQVKDKKRMAALQKGGVTSRASSGSAASSGRVSASTGDILSYAARVRARVAGNKPAGGGRKGTVAVSFGVTRSGSLSYASLARSSGDAALDRSVLSAVRGAGPFPAPPAGASPSQLRFSVSFYFR